MEGEDIGKGECEKKMGISVIWSRKEKIINKIVGRIDLRVVEDLIVDEFMRRIVEIGIEKIVRRIWRKIRENNIINELKRIRKMIGIGRDRNMVKKDKRELIRDRIEDIKKMIRILGEVEGMENIEGIEERNEDIEIGERIDILRRVEFEDIRKNIEIEIMWIMKIVRRRRVRVEKKIVKRRKKNLDGGIKKVNEEIFKIWSFLRIEKKVKGVDSVGEERLIDIGIIVEDEGSEKNVIEGILVERIIGWRKGRNIIKNIIEVRKIVIVEFKEKEWGNMEKKKLERWKKEVVEDEERKKIGLKNLVGVIEVVEEIDKGIIGEVIEDGIVDIIRKVIDIEKKIMREWGKCGRREKKSRKGSWKKEGFDKNNLIKYENKN